MFLNPSLCFPAFLFLMRIIGWFLLLIWVIHIIGWFLFLFLLLLFCFLLNVACHGSFQTHSEALEERGHTNGQKQKKYPFTCMQYHISK